MTVPAPSAERLAIALLRLHELGDRPAARRLVDGLGAEELRAVLLCQTNNVAMLGEKVGESRLPEIAEEFDRTPGQVTRDLERLVLVLAEAEQR